MYGPSLCLTKQRCGQGSAYLRALNKQNNPEAVIAAYESGSVASSEEALGEYVKALVRVNRLDSGALMQTLQVPPFLPPAAPLPSPTPPHPDPQHAVQDEPISWLPFHLMLSPLVRSDVASYSFVQCCTGRVLFTCSARECKGVPL